MRGKKAAVGRGVWSGDRPPLCVSRMFGVTAAAKDLRIEPPRDFSAELDGYAHLPRMFDKARAHLAGTSGKYTFGCPVDNTAMARLGIGPDLVLDVVGHHADDLEALAELKAHGIPSASEAWFDSQAVEDELQETGVYLRVRDRSALPGGVFAGDEHGAPGVSVMLVELAPGEEQSWHSHPTEEVIAVVDGEVTFFLGERQARTVRAGEVARVPAAVPHRAVNRGEGPLRAVAAYAGGAVATEDATQSTAM